MKVIELKQSVTASNDAEAQKLRNELKEKKTVMINLMSAPGAGKTTLLSRTITDLKNRYKIAIMEADIASSVDAERIEALGAQAIQVHTDGMCHMDALMTRESVEGLEDEDYDLLVLENVGNLICPAEYDTGATYDVMILSVPEGDDKPIKYPLMFERSHVLIISKIDTASYFDFDYDKCVERVRKLNPDIKIFPLSAKTSEGIEAWENWLVSVIEEMKK
ncbi:MAG: hydrogenase nickel incorporation protein HypB [Erysipelotrichaceae bacterium]|nr:hydrogenase nickel incorporation protein HypB [Erysipelotrichaceae bacterium]